MIPDRRAYGYEISAGTGQLSRRVRRYSSNGNARDFDRLLPDRQYLRVRTVGRVFRACRKESPKGYIVSSGLCSLHRQIAAVMTGGSNHGVCPHQSPG